MQQESVLLPSASGRTLFTRKKDVPPDAMPQHTRLLQLGEKHSQQDAPFSARGGSDAGVELGRVSKNSGFTLTEIALALAIFSFALVSMLGLLSVGMQNSRKANIQLSASNLLGAIAADVQASTRQTNPPATAGDPETYKFVSPKLNITAEVNSDTRTATAVTIDGGTSATIDESGSTVPAGSTTPTLLKQFNVTLTPGADGTPAVRVKIEWPAKRQPTASPEGSLNTLIPFPLP